MRLPFLLLGFAECRVEGARSADFLNLCRQRGLLYTPVTRGQAGEDFVFRCRLSLLPHMRQSCAACGIALTVVRYGGLPTLLWRYRKRVGLLIGGLLSLVLIFLATRVIWDVRVEGLERMALPEVYEQLRACGLSVGTWIPALETDEVEGRLLTESDEVAWVSVNVRGTVAYVQIRELMTPESARTRTPTNLVAGCDGVIESVRLIAGQPAVKAGDAVRQGELLVSGVRDSEAYGYLISSAQGEVLARTEHTITLYIPRVSEQKVFREQKIVEKTLFFFGKAIKVTKSTGIVTGNCDTIKKLEIWSLPGGVALPVYTEATVARTYEWQSVTWSDEQLYEQAYEQLERELSVHTAQATLLSQRVSSEVTDEGILLSCRYQCVENIAKALPIDTGAP